MLAAEAISLVEMLRERRDYRSAGLFRGKNYMPDRRVAAKCSNVVDPS